jgi:DNA-3-methyladenine glycosylase II
MPPQATRPAWAAAAADLAARHPVMDDLHRRHGAPRLAPGPAPAGRFEALASSIAYQQLAGRAAATIWGRVVDTVGRPFTPEAVLAAGPERLRAAGLSGAKTVALLDLAAKVDDGTLRLDRVSRWSDQEVVDHLVVVRGIGPWTAQMFLLFDLRRLDVWPTGDYGVRAGLARVHGWEELPSEKEMAALGEPYAPYRSVVAWWCWREVDTVTPPG